MENLGVFGRSGPGGKGEILEEVWRCPECGKEYRETYDDSHNPMEDVPGYGCSLVPDD